MYNLIERQLKMGTNPPQPPINKANVPSSMMNRNENKTDVAVFSRNEYTEAQKINVQKSQSEGLATLSVVNSHGHTQPTIHTQHGIPSQIQATITPVPSSQNSSQHVNSSGNHDKEMPLYNRSDEPQTLDLSIKKPIRENFPPPAHSKQPVSQTTTPSNSNITIFRTDPSPPIQQSQSQNPTFLSYHHDLSRPSKSPSSYLTNTSIPMNQLQQSQHQVQNSQRGSINQQMISHTPPPTQKGKAAPKLSPKIQQQHQAQSVNSQQQSSGSKGSITHGTVNVGGQQIITIQGQQYDSILRQTPPSSDKTGSITQGTPVHIPGHHMSGHEKQRVFDYYTKNRQSPAQAPSQQPSPQSSQFSSQYNRSAPQFSMDQPQQLSSRQIVMNDFITSQQMSTGGRSVVRTEKESQSPRGISITNPQSTVYYTEKDINSRPEFLSRASPADHVNRYVYNPFEK